jgi:hypothetical protein
MSQQLWVLDGDGLALVELVAVGEADAVVLVGAALVDSVATAELVVCSGVGDSLGDGEVEALCVGLAEALVAPAEDAGADAEVAAPLALEVPAEATATTLPAGVPSLLPLVLPYMRNPTKAMPAKPPVSISPIPRRFSPRREARVLRSSSAACAARPMSSLVSSSVSASAENPRRPPPADFEMLSLVLAAAASETSEGRGLSECRPASFGPATTSPS